MCASALKRKWTVASSFFVLVVCFVGLQYHIYIYWGETVTQTPFAGRSDQRDLLMRIGNRSVVGARPAWQHHVHFMTMCTMVRNEARYIREWVEFHSLVGVDRFVVFDNDSTDSLLLALKGTLADVSIVKWPPLQWQPGNPHQERCQGYKDGVYLDDWAYAYCQTAAFHECIQNERGRSRWIAGVDVDEFFMPRYDSRRLYTLQEVLKPYEHMHGVNLEAFEYGTNHFRLPIGPGELMIETHILRREKGGLVKEFVDPSKAATYHSVHWASYHNPFWNFRIVKSIPRHRGLVRFNHYPCRSLSEGRHKVFKNMNPGIFRQLSEWESADVEDLYMIPMVPLVKRRLAGEAIWIRGYG